MRDGSGGLIRLANCVAIVTGAAQGIGEAIARAADGQARPCFSRTCRNRDAYDVAESIGAEGANASATFVDVVDSGSADRMIATCQVAGGFRGVGGERSHRSPAAIAGAVENALGRPGVRSGGFR